MEMVEYAARLHGHKGPFLVIGVRMGTAGKRRMNISPELSSRLRVIVKTPLLTPYSCIIDGIQATTNCTVGNRKMKIEDSDEEISARFELQDPDKASAIRISVNPELIKKLIEGMTRGNTNEELAAKVANLPEEQLFALERP
jgi:formylmethanofuran dehydrogenase subunit E